MSRIMSSSRRLLCFFQATVDNYRGYIRANLSYINSAYIGAFYTIVQHF